MGLYPNNTPDEFTVNLNKTYELSDEWEVGLVEMIYVNNVNTISKSSFMLKDSRNNYVVFFRSRGTL